MLPHPLSKFDLQKYYQNELGFNDICSRNNLPKIKDGTYVAWQILMVTNQYEIIA